MSKSSLATLKLESRYVSTDGTRRYLFKAHDNRPVETVFIPEERRDTICFSSQVGMPASVHVLFDGTARSVTESHGWRDCRADHLRFERCLRRGRETTTRYKSGRHGAGEPFLNFEELMKGIRIMKEPTGLHIVPNRVTVSTAGIVPRIRELATIPDRPHLAVSLARPRMNCADELMPINKKWPLEELLSLAGGSKNL